MPVDRSIEMPDSMKRLPMHRGFPVPWFVGEVDGEPDFRVVEPTKLHLAIRGRRCWVCGGKMGRFMAYVAGPMCALNRTSAEPPSHRDCAIYSARACPFLSRPQARRRDAGLPAHQEMPGVAIMRNPKASMVWVVAGPLRMKSDGRGGRLFDLGEPVEVRWFYEGREATRAEVLESIETGLPALKQSVGYDGLSEGQRASADAELAQLVADIEPLVPA